MFFLGKSKVEVFSTKSIFVCLLVFITLFQLSAGYVFLFRTEHGKCKTDLNCPIPYLECVYGWCREIEDFCPFMKNNECNKTADCNLPKLVPLQKDMCICGCLNNECGCTIKGDSYPPGVTF